MIKQKIHLKEWEWVVYAYYSVGHYYTDEILAQLRRIGCDGEMLERAHDNLSSGHMDTGLTYSNGELRRSVMVVGNASSAEQFFNSLLHELRHLEEHIGEASGIEPYGEPVAYLIGDIAQAVYPRIKDLLCDCRRAT